VLGKEPAQRNRPRPGNQNRDELENKMSVLLGGRAAELTVFGHLSTGGNNPLMALREIALLSEFHPVFRKL
jgi:ATP-dependent Zn protease